MDAVGINQYVPVLARNQTKPRQKQQNPYEIFSVFIRWPYTYYFYNYLLSRKSYYTLYSRDTAYNTTSYSLELIINTIPCLFLYSIYV